MAPAPAADTAATPDANAPAPPETQANATPGTGEPMTAAAGDTATGDGSGTARPPAPAPGTPTPPGDADASTDNEPEDGPKEVEVTEGALKLAAKTGGTVEAVRDLVAAGQIKPTGKDGAVLKADVQKYLAAIDAAEKAERDADGDGEPDGAADGRLQHYRLMEKAGDSLTVIVGHDHRVLYPNVRYRLPAADPAVRALLESEHIEPA